ncbi:hypothetical protein CEUSTIGMA_g5357.t1 [Chlamydomonas eustigma]|uniref:Uncharacterized protein n=1 Tax=Chlamydomonas eustigma TaxID=1157962 RepID=A0A250X4C0_9CHLO|nr:hypothetical protein CEUSTIGMA_g5357.t1 [Chlamydomonas eustigma]|eukprot:GAX77915.1 hypothetical protein CEUSTIGMA_g5357.t1 [Chlamydomonas eustigma]
MSAPTSITEGNQIQLKDKVSIIEAKLSIMEANQIHITSKLSIIVGHIIIEMKQKKLDQLGQGFYFCYFCPYSQMRDSGVRQDLFHSFQLLRESMTAKHSHAHEAIEDLRNRLKVPQPVIPGCSLYPPPSCMLQSLTDWCTIQHDSVHATGEYLFTVDIVKVLEGIFADIIKWYLSDPWEKNADGAWVPKAMYSSSDGGQQYKCRRGSSSVESFHSKTNDVVHGTNSGDELVDMILQQKCGDINVKRAIALGVMPDGYDATSLPLMRDVNRAAQATGVTTRPYPHAEAYTSYDFGELQGYQWHVKR